MTKHHNSKACFNGPLPQMCPTPSDCSSFRCQSLRQDLRCRKKQTIRMVSEGTSSTGSGLNRNMATHSKTLYETMTKHDRPTMNGQGDTYQHHLPKTARHWWRKPSSYQSTEVSGLMSFALHRTIAMGPMVWGYSGVHDILPWPWPPPPACFFSQGYLDTRSTSASTLYIDIYVCVCPHVSLEQRLQLCSCMVLSIVFILVYPYRSNQPGMNNRHTYL